MLFISLTSLLPIAVASPVDIPLEARIVKAPMTSVIGPNIFTEDSASEPTRLPTTILSTDSMSKVERLVSIMVGIYSRSLRLVIPELLL